MTPAQRQRIRDRHRDALLHEGYRDNDFSLFLYP